MGINFAVVFIFAETMMAALYIVADLGGSYVTTGYTVAFYALGNVMSIPLGDKFPPLKFLKICLASLAITSILTYSATNYQFFNFFRFLQGLAAGPLYVLLPLFTTKPGDKKRFVRNFAVCYIMASTIGASLGGAIAYGYRWRWIGIMDLTLIVPFSIWLLWELRHKQVTFVPKKLDKLGFALYAVNVAIIFVFLTLGQELDWFRSHFLDVLFYSFCVLFPYFIFHCWDHPYPILDFSLFKKKAFAYAVFQLAFLLSSYFGMSLLLANWLHVTIEYSADYVSVLLAIASLSAIAISLLIYKMKKEFNLLWLALILMAIAGFFTMNFNFTVNFGRIALSHILFGSALPLFLFPLFHLMLDPLKKREIIEGIAFFQLTRVFFSGLGIAVYATVWQRRSYFYHSRLGGELTAFSLKTKAFFEKLKLFHLTEGQREAELGVALETQAKSLAINDTFFLISILMVLLLISMPFYQKWRES